MSRHRNVRSMNYSDEYDGYDDVYGHSVEDDYCMSPSEAAFMYDREGSKSTQKMGVFFQTVTDIAEENEGEECLSDADRAKLESCIDEIKQAIGTSVPRVDLVNIVMMYNFNVEKSINFILDNPQYNKDVKLLDKKDKDVNFLFKKPAKSFAIPKLNDLNTKCLNFPKSSPTSNNFSSFDELAKSHLNQNFTDHKEQKQTENKTNTAEFGSLADLTSHHLKKINFNTRPSFNKFSINEKTIDRLSDRVSSVNITRDKTFKATKSASAVEDRTLKNDIIDNNWHIDLSKALRAANSAPQIRRNKRTESLNASGTENFVPQFIDCDTEPENPKILTEFCNMDVGWILSTRCNNIKTVSKFGKVLCRRYKRPKPYFVNDESGIEDQLRKISAFKFNTLSPDDIVSSHLNK